MLASRWFTATFLIVLLGFAAVAQTVSAHPPAQDTNPPASTAYSTPTPLQDGRILYIVQPGDTLWKISIVTSVAIDQLERLNSIHRDDTLTPGTELLLGYGEPSSAEPTLAFQPTDTPTPIPVTGSGTICLMFFNDINGDTSQQEEEGLVAGGQISVALEDGTELGTYTTNGVDEPYCMNDLPAGTYNIAAAAPNNTNPTASLDQQGLVLEPGDTIYISFSVQGNAPTSANPQENSNSTSPILGVAGLALILSSIMLFIYVRRPKRRARW